MNTTTTEDKARLPQPLQVFDDPRDDPECFPKINKFMRALQDPGETLKPKNNKNASSSSTDVAIVYPKLMKALAGVQRSLQAKYAHLGIPKHPTDCKPKRHALFWHSMKLQRRNSETYHIEPQSLTNSL